MLTITQTVLWMYSSFLLVFAAVVWYRTKERYEELSQRNHHWRMGTSRYELPGEIHGDASMYLFRVKLNKTFQRGLAAIVKTDQLTVRVYLWKDDNGWVTIIPSEVRSWEFLEFDHLKEEDKHKVYELKLQQ